MLIISTRHFVSLTCVSFKSALSSRCWWPTKVFFRRLLSDINEKSVRKLSQGFCRTTKWHFILFFARQITGSLRCSFYTITHTLVRSLQTLSRSSPENQVPRFTTENQSNLLFLQLFVKRKGNGRVTKKANGFHVLYCFHATRRYLKELMGVCQGIVA